MPRLASLGTILLLAAAPLAAQSIGGRVVENSSELPVRGVLVELRNERGNRLTTALTDSSGNFRFAVPQAGVFRLLATRIGYQRALSQGFDVAPGEAVEVDLRISTSAVLMSPLTITSRPEPPRSRYLEMMGFYERE